MNEWTCLTIFGVVFVLSAVVGALICVFYKMHKMERAAYQQSQIKEIQRLCKEMTDRLVTDGIVEAKKEDSH